VIPPLLVPTAQRAFLTRKNEQGWTPPLTKNGRTPRDQPPSTPVNHTLSIDALVANDLGQSVVAHSFLYAIGIDIVAEGFVIPDGASPKLRAALRHYVAGHSALVNPVLAGPGGSKILILSQREFLNQFLNRRGYLQKAVIVGNDLPLVLSRLAQRVWFDSDGSGRVYLGMLGSSPKGRSWRDYVGSPGIQISPRGVGVKIEFRTQSPAAHTTMPDGTKVAAVAWDDSGRQFRGMFVDVVQAGQSLLGERYNLADLAALFSLHASIVERTTDSTIPTEDELDGLRGRTLVQNTIRRKLQEVLDMHTDSRVSLHELISSATVARGYLKSSGLLRGPQVDPAAQAIAFESFKGSRIEMTTVHVEVPVVVADLSAAYVRGAVLLGLESLVAAERLTTRDARATVRRLLKRTEQEVLLTLTSDPSTVSTLSRIFVEVLPQGEVFTTKVFLGDRSQPSLTTTSTFDDQYHWVHAFEFLEAILASGSVPAHRGVIEFVPKGVRTRNPIGFAGVPPHPGGLFATALGYESSQGDNDLSRAVALGTKAIRNSMVFGLLAQVTRVKGRQVPQIVHTPRGTFDFVGPEERLGTYACLPAAAAQTAFARLMLRRAQVQIEVLGGMVVAMDTDSLAIVATKNESVVACPGGSLVTKGGLPGIKSLDRDDVVSILDGEAWADPLGGGSPWKIKHDSAQRPLFHYGICNKRTALFRRGKSGRLELLDASEHVLGGRYFDPYGTEVKGSSGARQFVDDAWQHLIDPIRYPEPWWSCRPAVRVVTVNHHDQWDRLRAAGVDRPFGEVLQGEPARLWGDGAGPLAPRFSDLSQRVDWRSPADGTAIYVSLDVDVAAGLAGGDQTLATLGEVVAQWSATRDVRYEPLALSDGPVPLGLLAPRPIRTTAALTEYIGKESTLWASALAGDTPYDDPEWLSSFATLGDSWQLIGDAVRVMSFTAVATALGVVARTVERDLARTESPNDATVARYREVAFAHARGALGRGVGPKTRRTASERMQLATITLWLESDREGRLCAWPGCATAVSLRRTYCSDRCRKRAERQRDRERLAAIGAKRCSKCRAIRPLHDDEPCPICFGEVSRASSKCPGCSANFIGLAPSICPICETEIPR
jgi:hypothetical protein